MIRKIFTALSLALIVWAMASYAEVVSQNPNAEREYSDWNLIVILTEWGVDNAN